MAITKENLKWAIAALRQCAKENMGKKPDPGCGVVSDICTDVANLLEKPEDERGNHLYRVKNKIGEFYIVAHSFDEAVNELMERLRNADYGFIQDRTVPSIDHLAEETFYSDNKQAFDPDEANLIIVE